MICVPEDMHFITDCSSATGEFYLTRFPDFSHENYKLRAILPVCMFRTPFLLILLLVVSVHISELLACNAGSIWMGKQDKGDTLSVTDLIELSSRFAPLDAALALDYATRATKRADGDSEPGLRGIALINLGKIQYGYKDFVAAIDAFQLSAEHFGGLPGQELLEAKAYFEIGRSCKKLGNYAEALTAFQESYRLAEICGDTYLQVDLMRRSANISKHLREYDTAIEFARACIVLASAEGYGDFESEAYRELGYIYNKQKLYPEAISAFREALVLADTARLELFADAMEGLGNVFLKQGSLDSAMTYFLQALSYREAVEDAESLHILYLNIGETYEQLGNYKQARSFFSRSLTLARQEQKAGMLGNSMMRMARLAEKRKDFTAAEAGLLEALELLQKGGNRNVELICLKSLQEFYEKRGDFSSSLVYMKQLNELKSSIHTDELSRDMENMRVMYRTRLLNDEVKLMEQEAQIRELEAGRLSRRITLALGLSVMLIVVTLTLFYLWRQKSRLNRLNEVRNAELNAMNKELKELNRTKDKLFSIIGHDLKNPIGIIAGFNDILRGRYHEIDEQTRSDYLRIIGESIKNVSTLLDDLLEWSRAQRKTRQFRQHQFDLNELIRKNVELLSSSATKKQLTLEAETDRPLMIFADDHMVDTVLRNLLNNAVKFTASGGNIRIFAREEDQRMEVSVRDTGVGMEPEVAGNLFAGDQFISREGTDGEQGTGLGLVICKEFVEKHGGNLRVSSEPGKGSTFVFDLPRPVPV